MRRKTVSHRALDLRSNSLDGLVQRNAGLARNDILRRRRTLACVTRGLTPYAGHALRPRESLGANPLLVLGEEKLAIQVLQSKKKNVSLRGRCNEGDVAPTGIVRDILPSRPRRLRLTAKFSGLGCATVLTGREDRRCEIYDNSRHLQPGASADDNLAGPVFRFGVRATRPAIDLDGLLDRDCDGSNSCR